MRTDRRLLSALAATAALAAAGPTAAQAQGGGACTVPHALKDFPVATQYELDLFLGQTQFDAGRLTAANASLFVSATARRATSMTSALAGIATRTVTGTVAQPPTCP